MLAKRFPRLDADERLSLYHDAWARVYAKRERGEEIESLRAYLLATCSAEALNAVSRGKPPAPVDPDDPLLAGLADDRTAVEEQVVRRDQVRIARELIDSLDVRQRAVLKLRWDLQLGGGEIRAALGLSPRQYHRLVEEGAAAIAERVAELEDGTWSRRQRSLLAACLVEVTRDGEQRVGIASDRQRKEAQRLLQSDPHVAALYVEVRGVLQRAGALLPLPALFLDHGTSPAARLAEAATEVRDTVTNLLHGAKQHATSLYLRTADPTLLTPRSGTLAALAGSLAIGGGAYTVHQATTSSTQLASPSASIAQRMGQSRSSAASHVADRRSRRPKSRSARREIVDAQRSASQPEAAGRVQQPTSVGASTQHGQSAAATAEPVGDEFGFEGN